MTEQRAVQQMELPLSPVQLRWLLAVTHLVEAVERAQQKWRWPTDVPGCLERDVAPVAARLDGVNAHMLQSILRLRWERVKGRGDHAVLPVAQQVELALARFPLGLLGYLARSESTKVSVTEQLALLFSAYSFAANAEERARLHDCIEKVRMAAANTASATVKPRLPMAAFRTPSQELCFQQMRRLAELFFAGAGATAGLRVRPRMNPLVVGQTGCGKTYLVESLANDLGVYFRKVTFSDWIPVGAGHDYTPTLFSILESVVAHERVIVLIDELDKIPTEATSSWARSCLLDVWQLLDRHPPFGAFKKYSRMEEVSVFSEDQLRGRMTSSLWVVGAGTWQSLHRQNLSLGFATRSVDETALRQEIAQSKVLPDELMMRFNPDFLFLQYPRPQESQKIFEESGLLELARRVGVALEPSNHDWSRGGMRSLEDLATKLLLRERELQGGSVAELKFSQSRTETLASEAERILL